MRSSISPTGDTSGSGGGRGVEVGLAMPFVSPSQLAFSDMHFLRALLLVLKELKTLFRRRPTLAFTFDRLDLEPAA